MDPSARLVVALAPAVLLAVYFRRRVRATVPARAALAWFLVGIATIPAVMFVARPLGHAIGDLGDPWLTAFAHAVITAAACEEAVKFAALGLVVPRVHAPRTTEETLVAGALVGLGFAAFENLVYAFDLAPQAVTVRAFLAVPAHAAFGVVMARYLAYPRFADPRPASLAWAGLGIAIVLHGVYDFPILAAGLVPDLPRARLAPLAAATLLALVFSIAWGTWLLRAASARRLRDLDRAGHAPDPQASASWVPFGSDRPRVLVGWVFLLAGWLVVSFGSAALLTPVAHVLDPQSGAAVPVEVLRVWLATGIAALTVGLPVFVIGLRWIDASPPADR